MKGRASGGVKRAQNSNRSKFLCDLKYQQGPGEIVQWVKMPAALPDDPSFFPGGRRIWKISSGCPLLLPESHGRCIHAQKINYK